MTTELILKAKELSLDDLPFLKTLGHIENAMIIFDHSLKGCRLKTPVIVPVDRILAVGQKGLIEFIVSSLISQRPDLYRGS